MNLDPNASRILRATLVAFVIVCLMYVASDVLKPLALAILRMLNLVLKPSGVRLTVLSASGSPMRLSDKIEQLQPGLIVMSHLPPLGLTSTRYLIKRIRARHPDVPMVVGFWDAKADSVQVAEKLRSSSAYHVALSLATVRTMILDRTVPKLPAVASAS